MDYQVESPVVVNGQRRRRGDILTGDDAAAVEASPTIKARCIPYPYSALKAQAASAKPAPSSSSASKAAAAKGE